MIANRGALDGTRILRPETVDMMTGPQLLPGFPGLIERSGPGLTMGLGCLVATDISAAGGGGNDGLYFFSGAANLFAWADRTSGIVALAWAQALPFQVYPFFQDLRSASAHTTAW